MKLYLRIDGQFPSTTSTCDPKMVLKTFFRLLAVLVCAFFVVCITIAWKTLQLPLSPIPGPPSTKLLDLQTSLATRMASHNAFTSKHLHNVDANLGIIPPQIEKSVSNLFYLQDQMENMPESIQSDHLAALVEHFSFIGEDFKMLIINSIDSIKQSIVAMEQETESMEMFMKHMSEEISRLQSEILWRSNKKNFYAPYFRTGNDDQQPVELPGKHSPEWTNLRSGEHSLLLETFMHRLNTSGTFSRAYTALPEKYLGRRATNARFTGIFNTSIVHDLLANDVCDYLCNATAEVQFDRPIAGKEIGFHYKDIDMNCSVSSIGQVEGSLRHVTTESIRLKAWSEFWSPTGDDAEF